MAHWDDEHFHTQEPPADIMCKTCKYRLKPITVGDFTKERYTYSICDKYASKPVDINWGRTPCPLYEKEQDNGS